MLMKNKFIILIASILLLTSFVFAQTNQGFYGCGMGAMMYGTYGFGLMAFGWIFSILILVALILLIFWLVKQIQKK